MHKLHVYAVGGDYADNGVDQLIIDGEAMPVLKALIKEGKTPGVCEGAVRLLTRLCSTPEARQEVAQPSSPHNLCLDCLASVVPRDIVPHHVATAAGHISHDKCLSPC